MNATSRKHTGTDRSRLRSQKRLARRIAGVANAMRRLGVYMDYYGGFNEIGKHGREMIGAADIAKGWADELSSSGIK